MTTNQPGPLLAALQTLYGNSERSQKEQASKFLEDFQKSQEAWQLALSLLQEDASVEAKLFAAQTLRMKIALDSHQLPSTALEPLRDNLVQLIVRYATGPKPILTALCVAVATLALQLSQWTTMLQDMMQVLSKDLDSWQALLLFLSILPEELSEDRKLGLSQQQLQERVEQLLTGNAKTVLELLCVYTQMTQKEGRRPSPLLLTCLQTWLREIPVIDMIRSPLVELAFSALSDDDLFEAAVDFLCAVFAETSEVNDSTVVASIEILFPSLMSLRPRLAASKDDSDAFRGYARLFSEAGEAWVILCARQPQQFKTLVEAIAEAAAVDEDLEIVKFTFLFWYDLKQALLSERYAEAKAVYAPIYAGLVDILIAHLHYPLTNDDDLFNGDKEAEETFRSFRHEMGDVLKDCCNVVGGSICLGKAFTKVQQLLASPSAQWQQVEAPLFSMRAMAREISTDEEEVLPQIMETLLSLPEHPKIRYAATLVLGRYTEWTARHPEVLLPQLNYITSGFKRTDRDVTSAAALALKHFCQDCSTHLVPHIAQLHGFYEQVLPELDFDSKLETTEAIGHVVLAQPREALQQSLQPFLLPFKDRLAAAELQQVADDVELLTVFCCTVDPYVEAGDAHPCVAAFSELWPAISTLLDRNGSHPLIAERTCRFMKEFVSHYRRHALPLLPVMAEKLAAGFATHQQGCYLWASGACIREFADAEYNAPETVDAVWSFVEGQSVGMFKLLSTTTPESIPDVVEDFFRLSMDALLGNPDRFLQSAYLSTFMQASLACLSMEHRDALTAVLRFLRDLSVWLLPEPPTSGQSISDPARQALQQLMMTQGQALATAVFVGQIYTFPRDCITDASGVLLTLLEWQPEATFLWIEAALSTLPAGSVSADEQTGLLGKAQTALQEPGDAQARVRKVRSILQDFTTLYRRRMVNSRQTIRHEWQFRF
ncbi:armadillo-type protein [Protomyces lactucae-debilis]|uniref:Armadillo-type protein n=1 Tax=Protomyces lactucae-debilis TaxID=2754530 RepID=A0A1Y2FID5_PROLT|nr:armadillo-type protein [Protomyces lactucae-debilis]ORY83698.1 armadillo-type protein [Protomyces lactucae-debilis]